VLLEGGAHDPRYRDNATPDLFLRGPEVEPARHLHQVLGDVDASAKDVDTLGSQTEHFTYTQTTVRTEQDKSAEAEVD
jgi:hypothetical protein